jgi:nanoRNase/pAp phosphatase (c-di-AMP/oligoRNAs hydrolase)
MNSTTTTKKRKSDASSGLTFKKARAADGDHNDAKALVSNILADTKNYRMPSEDDDVKKHLVSLALYARSLEQTQELSLRRRKRS